MAGPVRQRVAMLLENNPYPQDVRVRREAEALAAAGHRVRVIAPRDAGQPRRETIASVEVRRFRAPLGGTGARSIAAEYAVAVPKLHLAALRELARRGDGPAPAQPARPARRGGAARADARPPRRLRPPRPVPRARRREDRGARARRPRARRRARDVRRQQPRARDERVDGAGRPRAWPRRARPRRGRAQRTARRLARRAAARRPARARSAIRSSSTSARSPARTASRASRRSCGG